MVRHRNHPFFPSISRVLSITVVVSFAVCFAPAANGADVIRPFISYAVNYDSNILGLNDISLSEVLAGMPDASDISTTLRAGIKLNKQISRQNITANVSISRTAFNNYNELDHQGRDVSINWNWHLGNHIEGNVGGTEIRMLTPFSDFHELARNLRTQRREYADGAWTFHPKWRVRSAASRYVMQYDLVAQRSGNIREERADVGLDYLARSGSTMGWVMSRIRGKFPDRADFTGLGNRYTQDEIKGRVDWLASGKTRIRLLAGWVARQHDHTGSQDFDGANVRVTMEWLVTGKTSLIGSAWRETVAAEDVFAAYSINQGLSFAPRWKISDKLSLDANLVYEKRNLQRSSANLTDTNRTATLSLTYIPLRNTVLQFSIFSADREGVTRSSGYERQGAAFSAQYQY